MINQKEFFKKLHPDQFSDSKIVKKGKLDRNFLDFYLETLTSKSLEKSFENFCRTIAEAEICPNLLPQTGPTGGGDSKVDSETYPVAESLSELWYYGDGNKAASERWAFAISAKKEWKTKIKSDVDKIVKVNIENNRSYSKIFFMSNQYIPDKKRADTEDDLRKTYNIDVRILDRTWLLEKALKNQKNIETTINAFGLSDNFSDEVELGDKDYKRRKEYDEIESQICTQNIKPSAMVSLSQKSLILARELEFSKQEILGIIDRNNRIAREVGTPLDIANSIYDAAWTIFWWYPDEKLYYEFYKEFEEIVISENNVKLFENLITLWISLFSISKETEDFSVNKHAETIKEKYVEFTSDTSKPNTILEAKAVYQPMRIFLNDSTDDIVDDMILIVKDSFGHLDLNLNTISRLIQEFSIFEDAQNYNELFELIVSTLSKQKQKSEAAKMLINRGRLLKDKKPYEALAYFSRAIMSLYNEADKSFLINVILEMGNIFENIGLFWAARNFYYYDFCLCLNQYFKYGEVHQALLISSYALKCVELKLGHILYAVKFDELLNFAENIYPDDIKSIEEERNHFDYILGIQILRTKYKTIEKLCRLPAFLENQGMYLACASIKYKLGHYDETILKSLNDDTDAFDDLINKMHTQPVIDELTFEPWYGVEPSCIMKTNLLGCSIELHTSSPYDHGEIEFGASILAVLESFFGTGILNSLLIIIR